MHLSQARYAKVSMDPPGSGWIHLSQAGHAKVNTEPLGSGYNGLVAAGLTWVPLAQAAPLRIRPDQPRPGRIDLVGRGWL